MLKNYYNAKIPKTEGKIPGITAFATSAALTVVENKKTDVSSLVNQRF